jgi:hypothetical protein
VEGRVPVFTTKGAESTLHDANRSLLKKGSRKKAFTTKGAESTLHDANRHGGSGRVFLTLKGH